MLWSFFYLGFRITKIRVIPVIYVGVNVYIDSISQ